MIERLERRVLAGIRLVDPSTSRAPDDAFVVVGPGEWVQNRSGHWVLVSHPDLPSLERAFDPPATQPASIEVTAEARPLGRAYLARSFTFTVPRAGSQAFEPIVVHTPPSPARSLRPAWAAVRVTARLAEGGGFPAAPLEGALVRLAVHSGPVKCLGLTDARGEALVISSGLGAFDMPSGDPEAPPGSAPHTILLVYDPAATDPVTGRRTTPADPEDLWTRRNSLSLRTSPTRPLSPGQQVAVVVEFPRT